MNAAKVLWDAEAKSHALDLKVAAGIEVSKAEIDAVRSDVETAALTKKIAADAVAATPTTTAPQSSGCSISAVLTAWRSAAAPSSP
jgi:hypothetical protein